MATRGYVQIIDILYQAYYEGGLRVVDVSGELMGNLQTQGREIAVFKAYDPVGYVPNSPMGWSAMPFKGRIFSRTPTLGCGRRGWCRGAGQ